MCGLCGSWVHAACEGLTREQFKDLLTSSVTQLKILRITVILINVWFGTNSLFSNSSAVALIKA